MNSLCKYLSVSDRWWESTEHVRGLQRDNRGVSTGPVLKQTPHERIVRIFRFDRNGGIRNAASCYSLMAEIDRPAYGRCSAISQVAIGEIAPRSSPISWITWETPSAFSSLALVSGSWATPVKPITLQPAARAAVAPVTLSSTTRQWAGMKPARLAASW